MIKERLDAEQEQTNLSDKPMIRRSSSLETLAKTDSQDVSKLMRAQQQD